MWFNNKMKLKAGGFLLILLIGAQFLVGCTFVKPIEQSDDFTKPAKEQLQKLELLNQTADDMYKKVMEGDLSGGRVALQQLSEQITQIHYEGITSVEGLNALTEAVAQSKRLFNSVKLSQEEGQASVATIRLATDALTHSKEPMRMQYYNVLQNDLNEMERSVTAQLKPELVSVDAKFRQHIAIIHPSLLINRDPVEVEKLDSLVLFVSEQIRSEQDAYKQIQNILPSLRQTIDILFLKKEATAYLPIMDDHHPMMWTLVMGLIILSVLSFAAWRLARKNEGITTIRKRLEE